MSDKNKGSLALLLTAVLWGTGFISQKMGNAVMPPMTFNAIRQLMAGIVLMPIVIHGLKKSGYLSPETNSSEQLAYRRNKALKGGLICGMFTLIGTATQQIGLLTVSAGKSGFISAVYIVLVPVFSLLLGQSVKKKQVFCVLLAMAGFAVMSLSSGLGNATAGDWLTLISAAGFAAQIVSVNLFVDRHNAVLLSCLQFYVCGALGLVIALVTEGPTLAAVIAGVPVLLYQTFVPTAGGYTLQIVGQRYTDSSLAALIMSTEAVFAAVFGALILGEIMSVREIAGSAIILAATLIGQIEPGRKDQK